MRECLNESDEFFIQGGLNQNSQVVLGKWHWTRRVHMRPSCTMTTDLVDFLSLGLSSLDIGDVAWIGSTIICVI